jgi:hypothetical protein
MGGGLPGKIISDRPSVGVVVGTFASAGNIHLHLEARRRFYPDVPLLVRDDASPDTMRLNDLCGDYGADFSTASVRAPEYCDGCAC